LLGGCGYSGSPLIATHYKTIAVDIFKNETRYRDFEFTLANALKNEIVRKTQMQLAPRNEAETVLTGKILSFEQFVVTETTTDEVREMEVKITLSFEWRDAQTGRVIHRRGRFTRTADARLPLGETLETASAQVLAKIAEDVIDDLETEW